MLGEVLAGDSWPPLKHGARLIIRLAALRVIGIPMRLRKRFIIMLRVQRVGVHLLAQQVLDKATAPPAVLRYASRSASASDVTMEESDPGPNR